jgi:hypothetical protein
MPDGVHTVMSAVEQSNEQIAATLEAMAAAIRASPTAVAMSTVDVAGNVRSHVCPEFAVVRDGCVVVGAPAAARFVTPRGVDVVVDEDTLVVFASSG